MTVSCNVGHQIAIFYQPFCEILLVLNISPDNIGINGANLNILSDKKHAVNGHIHSAIAITINFYYNENIL